MDMNHGELLRMVLLYLHTNHTGRYWKNETGNGLSLDGKRRLSYGLVGSSDIIGFTGNGQAVFVEIKVGKDKLSKQQKIFKEITELNGCVHIVVHDTIVPTAFKKIPKKE